MSNISGILELTLNNRISVKTILHEKYIILLKGNLGKYTMLQEYFTILHKNNIMAWE